MADNTPDADGRVVELAGVSKRYGYRHVLRHITLHIPRGEFLVLLGHNGAGKTTLLQIMATQVSPTKGMVRLFGRDPRVEGSSARRRIGLVTHESFLYPELTVLENLQFYGQFYPVAESRYREMLEMFEIRPYAGVRAGSLSFGLRRRVDMARALLHDPDLLLLDEPFAGLDERTARLLGEHLAALKETGITLAMTTHSPEKAGLIGDRAITLDKGSIVQDIQYAA
jgi:ABC-type multidrug transport system ATPase subunit